MSTRGDSIITLNGWRGIFAIVIVMTHSGVEILKSATNLGVSFFFVVSGFLLTIHHYRNTSVTPAAWWKFWWRRARHVYLIHWIALACFMVLYAFVSHRDVQWHTLTAQIALVHCWVNDKAFYFGYNGVSWFLGALLFCYACFPLVNRYFSRLRLRYQVLIMAVAAALAAWWLPQLEYMQRIYTYVCPIFRLGDFLMGVTAANVYRSIKHTPVTYGTTRATLIEAGVVLIALEVMFIDINTEVLKPWCDYLIWWIPATIIVFSFTMLNGNEGLIGRLLCTKPFQLLGKWSMEIYIFQLVAADIVNYFISPVYGHFGLMVYDRYVWTQLPLLLVMACAIHSLMPHPDNRHAASGKVPRGSSISKKN